MPKAYLVAGAPRVGKTTLVTRLVAQRPMFSISTDAVRYMLRRVVPRTDQNKALFTAIEREEKAPLEDRLNYLADALQVAKDQGAESRIVWEATKQIIYSNMEDGLDIAVEGVAVLPEFLGDLNCEWRAVVLGNSSDTIGQVIRKSMAKNPHDWLNGREEQIIEAYIKFFKENNIHFKQQAGNSNLPFFDSAEHGYDAAMTGALEELLR